jgi:uncharacterized protein
MSSFEVLLLAVMLAGLLGVVVPVAPGLVLVLGAGLVWAVDGDGVMPWVVVAAMTIVGATGLVVATVLPARRASSAGAPAWVVAAGGAGLVIGFFVVPVIGALIGFPAGVFVAELLRRRQPGPAWTASWEVVKATGAGIMVQLAAGVAMIALWLGAVLVE